jgi:hypothetical protein
MKRFNFKKVNEVEGKEPYRVNHMISFLENLEAGVGINRDWETVEGKMKISARESLGYYEL